MDFKYLKGRDFVVGVTGGIAAYKTADIVRLMAQAGCGCRVVMTGNAARFVCPLTFQALSGRGVIASLFSHSDDASIRHVELAYSASAFVVAPATANVIAKLACGIADDALTTIVLASKAPVLLAPAMETNMWENPATRRNVSTLLATGRFRVVGPEAGGLASGREGRGRMSEPAAIIEELEGIVAPNDFDRRKIVVSAGPTREPFDPVRFISNRSSGKMGYAVARAAKARGARVVLVSGPTALPGVRGAEIVRVETAEEMKDAVLEAAKGADAVVMAAAVSDFAPARRLGGKLKKETGAPEAELVRTPDILLELGRRKGRGRMILAGFAAETENLEENARKKLSGKRLDLIVANTVGESSGFDAETNEALILDRTGGREEVPLVSKYELGHRILDRVVGLLKSPAS